MAVILCLHTWKQATFKGVIMGFRRVLDIEVMEEGDVSIEESDYLKSLSDDQKIQVLKSYLESLREKLTKTS